MPTVAIPDLTLAVTDAPDPVFVGGVLTYTISVTNAGKGAANATVVVDELPSGVAVQSLGTGCYLAGDAGTTAVCQVPPLAGGAKVSFTLLVVVNAPVGTAITNSAYVDPSNSVWEADRGNNGATTTTIVGAGTPPTATATLRPTSTPPIPTAVPPTATPRPAPAAVATAAPATTAPSRASTASSDNPLWLRITSDVPTYSYSTAAIGDASPGEWYRVERLEPGWALASWEGDPPTALVWVELSAGVQVVAADRHLPSPPAETWLLILGPLQTYAPSGAPQRIAVPGERYRVIAQDGGWAFAIGESDPPSRAVWIELDPLVQLLGGDGSPTEPLPT